MVNPTKGDVRYMEQNLNIHLALRQSIPDQLAGILSVKIFQGEFPPHYVFPSETVFCKQLGIGRNALREAYKILESNGFIVRTKRGTFVAERDAYLPKMPVDLLMHLTENAKALEYREMIECAIIVYSAKNATQDNFDRMQQLIEEMSKNKYDPEARIHADFLFHLEVAKAAKNDLFLTAFKPIEDLVLNPDNIEKSRQRLITHTEIAVYHHTMILEALKSRDGLAAQNAMRTHLEDYGDHLLRPSGSHSPSDKKENFSKGR